MGKTTFIPQKLARLLVERKRLISVCESCTGGLISKYLTDIPGASKYYRGGIIAYSNEIKTKILGVKKPLISKHGAVSKIVAEKMASGIKKLMNTDIGIGITGIAGPSGGSKNKPVGLIFIAIAEGKTVISHELRLRGTRRNIREKAAMSALELTIKHIL